MGSHAVDEVFKVNPSRLLHIYTSKRSNKCSLFNKAGIPITILSNEALSKMVGTDSHQGLVAEVSPRAYLSLKEFFSNPREKSVVLMLDQIFDPQNFGALLRSAECFGVDAVVFSKNRGSEITPTVTKASCGASELIPLIRVSNLADAMGKFQGEGYEAVTSVLSEDATSLADFTFYKKTLLIVGSEGEGVQPLIQKKSDVKIYIPMTGKIQSLNVAQASTTLLYLATQAIGLNSLE